MKMDGKSEEISLSPSNMQALIDLTDELETDDFISEKQIVTDNGNIAFMYNFSKLADKFIKVSPIPVDLPGWA